MGSKAHKLTLSTGIEVPCFIDGDPDARPLLLLHAWGESFESFDRLAPLLAGFRIYAPDLRGQGDADKPEDGYSLAEQAADVAAILDALEVPRAFVLGSSSGGYVAQALAAGRPERVAALVLVGAPLSLRGWPAFADEVETLVDPIGAAWVRESLTWFPLLHEVPAWFIDDRVDDGTRMPAHVWRAILKGLCEAAPPTESGTIATPTLVLWGGHDHLLSLADEQALAARIAGSVLKVYPDTGHLVLWECPERVAADTTDFLRSVG
ncbi:alpha/beta fold hydrolase [Paeniglutamicibacter psychrophenolicus]|uniref:alpha/beta fold hydrolase n=1 Tax=Paeniglutamicibacter psychrophenolicus TaxID=257454 RepID=UPI0027875016|nr:alpha/beta hydrolase [Paeniglutamicibacter psychrophenolicus]MDQ0093302.1 rifampin ADP-ribosylating transferase [Paeniglutamicibacter psychrophenolicus]